MTAVKNFLHNNKKWIALGVAFLVGGLAAVGVQVPAAVVDIVNGLVTGL